MGFDESYFKYPDKPWNESYLPNIIYVIATRAKEKLILCQSDKEKEFRTIATNQTLLETCSVSGNSILQEVKIEKSKDIKLSVTDLVRHRNTSDISNLISLVKRIISEATEMLKYENLAPFGGYYEEMKRYYGKLVKKYAS